MNDKQLEQEMVTYERERLINLLLDVETKLDYQIEFEKIINTHNE